MDKTITFIAEDKKRERMIAEEDLSDQEVVSTQPLQENENDPDKNLHQINTYDFRKPSIS